MQSKYCVTPLWKLVAWGKVACCWNPVPSPDSTLPHQAEVSQRPDSLIRGRPEESGCQDQGRSFWHSQKKGWELGSSREGWGQKAKLSSAFGNTKVRVVKRQLWAVRSRSKTGRQAAGEEAREASLSFCSPPGGARRKGMNTGMVGLGPRSPIKKWADWAQTRNWLSSDKRKWE